MKRIIIATLSTLVLSTLVTPGAKAIRPELLSHPVHPTISEATPSIAPSEMTAEPSQKPVSQSAPKTNSATVKPQQSDDPPFGYFEKVYREKYGS
jgi:hypothetical protein